MGSKKGEKNQDAPGTILKTYRNMRGDILSHDPHHERCRGTGFLNENYAVGTEAGEAWKSRVWDCSCRNDLSNRPNWDRDNPQMRGMAQGQLDTEEYRARYSTEEKVHMEGIVSRLMAMPTGKRFGAVMSFVKPAPREMPEITVIQ